MKILALELSSARGSLALAMEDAAPAATAAPAKDGLVREWANDRKHSGPFFEYLEEVTKEHGKPEKIVVGLGPGSYAGTRIAISTAIGLQAATGAKLVGYASICAMECEAREYCVIGDARRDSLFFARIRANSLAEGPTLMSEAELTGKLGTLDSGMPLFSSESLPQFARAELRYPSAKILVRLARDLERPFLMPPLEPMYLREPHITVPRST